MSYTFANWLEKRLADNDMLAVDLAKRLKMSHSSISCYRHGKAWPRYSTLVALCQVLGDNPEKVWALIRQQRELENMGDTVFVDFERYCKTCAHQKKKETDEPCNACLEVPARADGEKPINWKDKNRNARN